MKAKLILALALSAVLLFGCTGCKSNDDENRGSSGEYENDEYTKDLTVEDYDGYEFRILIRPGKTTDQYVEEGSANPVEDAVYKRNMLIENMYNIKIVATESSNSDGETDALNSILAGDDAYDVIFPHSGSAFSYAVQGALHNYHEIDAIHLDKPWWSQDIVKNATVNGNLYILDGDISLHRLSFAMCMFFNKRIFDDLGLDYPYQMVEDGTWTFDQFEKYVKMGADDLNGDGVMRPEDDQYGFWTPEWNSPIAMIYTGGQRIYTKNDEGIPELTLNSTKTVTMFDRYFDLIDNSASFLHFTGEPSNYTGGSAFKEGRAMFHDQILGSAQGFRDMDDDFGIIPYPKFTENDNYGTIVNGHAHLMLIPITIEDTERTGNIVEALCAIGSRDVVPAFYDVSLKTKFSRDTESERMIDLVRESTVYDLGYVSGGTFQTVGRTLARNATHDFASYYASNEAAALNKLAEFNEAYGDIEQ